MAVIAIGAQCRDYIMGNLFTITNIEVKRESDTFITLDNGSTHQLRRFVVSFIPHPRENWDLIQIGEKEYILDYNNHANGSDDSDYWGLTRLLRK